MKNVLVALVLVLATVGYGQVGRYLPAGGTNGQVLGVSPSNVPWWTNASGGSGSGFPLTTNVSFGDYGASNINYLEMRDPVSGTRVRLSANTNGGLVGSAWMLTSSNLLFGTGITVTTNIANGTLTLNAAGGTGLTTSNDLGTLTVVFTNTGTGALKLRRPAGITGSNIVEIWDTNAASATLTILGNGTLSAASVGGNSVGALNSAASMNTLGEIQAIFSGQLELNPQSVTTGYGIFARLVSASNGLAYQSTPNITNPTNTAMWGFFSMNTNMPTSVMQKALVVHPGSTGTPAVTASPVTYVRAQYGTNEGWVPFYQ